MTTDISISDQGSLVGFTVETKAAEDWIDHNVASEGWQWMGRTLWVDHRCAEDLAILIELQTDLVIHPSYIN